jgi:hypothetical protein
MRTSNLAHSETSKAAHSVTKHSLKKVDFRLEQSTMEFYNTLITTKSNRDNKTENISVYVMCNMIMPTQDVKNF